MDRAAQYRKLLVPLTKMLESTTPQHWADLGCGNGIFTGLLAEALPAESTIIAVDKIQQHLEINTNNNIAISFLQADFEKEKLNLPVLDGIMMANSFHYIYNKPALIQQLEKNFNHNKQFLLIEYDTDVTNQWVPYPLSFQNCQALFTDAGYSSVKKLGSIASGYGGEMYAALISPS